MNAKEAVKVPKRKRCVVMPRRPATRPVALLLALAIAFSAPLAALADADRAATGQALAAADAVKQKALRRLNEEATRIIDEDRRQLKLALRDALSELLQPLEASFTEAQGIVAREIGAPDSRETVERKMEEPLERA